MNPYCTWIRVLFNAGHIDSLFIGAENQFFVDNSTINSSIIDSLFRSLRNCLDVLFYSFLDSLTLQFREYSECFKGLLCWGLGECSICLFTNVLCKSSNLNFISLLLLLFLDSICHLNMNIVLLIIKDDPAAQKKRRFEAFWTLYSNCSLFVQIICFMDIEYADNDIGGFDGWMDCACEWV